MGTLKLQFKSKLLKKLAKREKFIPPIFFKNKVKLMELIKSET